MPTVGEFIPTFGAALHNSAERFAAKAGGSPQVQQAAYFESLYGLLVASEWTVGERLQQQGVPGPARDFISRFVRNQVLADVVPRRMAGFSPSSQDLATAVAGHRNLVDQREREYRQGVTGNNVPFSQLNAARVLSAVGINPNDPNSLGAATRDVDEAISALRLPEAAVYLTQQ
jgi:hypothetical protein